MAAAPQFIASPNNQFTKIDSSGGTDPVSVFTAGANGSMVRGFLMLLVNMTTRTFRVYVKRGGVRYALVDVTVDNRITYSPLVPAINIIEPLYLPFLDDSPNRGLIMAAGDELEVQPSVGIGVDGFCDVTVWAGDY